MTQPMSHDDRVRARARDLYVRVYDRDNALTAREAAGRRMTRGAEWDKGMVTDEDLAYFTTEAAKQLAEEAQQ